MPIRFEQPEWFWLLLLAAPIVFLAAVWFVAMTPSRRASAIILRFALLALILAMLASAASVRRTSILAAVAVIDVSGSVRRFGDQTIENGERIDAVEAVRRYLAVASARRGPEDLLGIVVFDGAAAAVATPSRGNVLERGFDVTMRQGTNIAEAIRLGRALIPPDAAGRIVLFSDGHETGGAALAAIRELRSGSPLAIDVVPIRYNLESEVVVESVDVPPTAAAESTVSARVVLRSTGRSTGTLRLYREGQQLDIAAAGEEGPGRRLTLEPGLSVQVVSVPLDQGRVHRFRAVFEPDIIETEGGQARSGDRVAENNAAEAFTITPGKGSVLLVDGVSGGRAGGAGSTLAAALEENGIATQVIASGAIPGDLIGLQAFDMIILENVPADVVPPAMQQQLMAYVRDLGGGLAMVGGPDSFGAGGWIGSDLAEILPVRLDLPERLVAPEAATVFILDNSGSMRRTVLGSTDTQQAVANAAAALAARSLDKSDEVAVVTFNSIADVLIPLRRNDKPEEVAQRILSIGSGGGTDMAPALYLARDQLRKSEAKLRHVVVLTDGRSRSSESLPDIAASMAADGIRISTIAVGDDADTGSLARMAERGGGTFYNAVNPLALPQIFLKAVRVVRTPLIRESPFEPVIRDTGSAFVEGLGTPPPLNGIVLTRRREEPTILLPMVTPANEPLLAHWNVGLGRVVAFTSDAHEWAQPWLDWPGYQQFWTQVTRGASRQPTSRTFQAGATPQDGRLAIRIEALDDDGRPIDGVEMPATVFTPRGDAREIRLMQTGPGVYEAAIDATDPGSYVALVKPRRGDQRLEPVTVGGTVGEGDEFRVFEDNAELLEAIAAEAGGRVLDLADPAAAELFNRAGIPPREAVTPLWPVLLSWAIAVFLADVATRRIAWDRWVSRAFGAGVVDAARRSIEARGGQAAATMDALRSGRSAQPVATTEPAISLSSDDAAKLAAQARDRRRKERLAAVKDAASSAPIVDRASASGREDKEAGSGLLAAKRRATERFED